MTRIDGEALLKRLPKVRGRLMPNAPLADLTWFKTGGPEKHARQPVAVHRAGKSLGVDPRGPVQLEWPGRPASL